MYQDRYWHDQEFGTVDELGQIADKAGISLVTLAVAWVLANPAVTAPIIGASRPEQLQASLDAADLTLDGDLKRQLDERTQQYRLGDAPR
jgi:aryl-alcohol dehydrogenase-like predicted oxidoreductase